MFLFQYIRSDGRVAGYSNWFITSCTNNRLLLVLRDMLYAYWRDFDCVLDYYIFHFFFSMRQIGFPVRLQLCLAATTI
ncbi:MAG: capsular polysaccharide synthesis protein [Clostridium sp.]|nr:capsular polysaccharide synthesis protein [Clostridium sp.]